MQRLARLRLQLYLLSLAEREASESVPFGLVEPAGTGRHFFDGLALRWRIGRTDR